MAKSVSELKKGDTMKREELIAEFLEEHGEIGSELLAHFSDLDDARKALNENYAGEFKSVGEFTEMITTDTTTLPDNLSFYIDYDRMGRDMAMSGDIFTIETGYQELHIFWSH